MSKRLCQVTLLGAAIVAAFAAWAIPDMRTWFTAWAIGFPIVAIALEMIP